MESLQVSACGQEFRMTSSEGFTGPPGTSVSQGTFRIT